MSQETKPQIKISEVLDLLEKGKTRPEIAEHYGITASDVVTLFKHKSLVGKRPKKQPNFEIVDDTQEVAETVSEEVANGQAHRPFSDVEEELEEQD